MGLISLDGITESPTLPITDRDAQVAVPVVGQENGS
jgi:hypothetical protein